MPLGPSRGVTDSLSLGTNLETTVHLFGHGQPLVLQPPNVQPPLFMEAQEQHFHIVTFRWIHLFIWFDFTKSNCITTTWKHTSVIWCETLIIINRFDSHLWAFIMTGQPLLFGYVGVWQPQLHGSKATVGPFSRLSTPPPPPPPPIQGVPLVPISLYILNMWWVNW